MPDDQQRAGVDRQSVGFGHRGWKMTKRLFVFSIVTVFFLIVAGLFFLTSDKIDIRGGCIETSSPFVQKHFGDGGLITYCGAGDSFEGKILSNKIRGDGRIFFEYAGYPSRPGLGVFLVNSVGYQEKIDLPDAGEQWRVHRLKIPERFVGSDFHLLAQDSSTQPFGWLGLGKVSSQGLSSGFDFVARMLIVSIEFFMLLTVFLTVLCEKNDISDAMAILLLSIGVYGYLCFFVYVKNVKIGIAFSAAPLVCLLFFVFRIFNRGLFSEFLRSLRMISPVLFLTVLIIVVGYYPFLPLDADSWQVAANRWLNLPIDNWLPKILADQLWGGGIRRPMIGDWLSSDRPPLQTGVLLIFYPMMVGSAVLYQTVATMLQLLVIPAIWCLLRRLGYSGNRPFLILVVCASSLVAVHSLFVWPKLISTVYVILCFIYIWAERSCRIRVFVVGTSAALAMLSHGGAVFALAGIFSVWLLIQLRSGFFKKPFFDCLAYAGIFATLMLPWIIYGKYIDPEYGRLIKWHLAGLVDPSQISVFKALSYSYGKLGFSEWIDGRLANISTIVSGNLVIDFLSAGGGAIADIRVRSFYSLFFSMWFCSPFLALLLWILSGFPALPMNLWRFFWSSIAGCCFWAVLMFDPGSTVIHQGSYFIWIGLFIWSAIVIQAVSKNISIVVFYLNVLVFLRVYVVDVNFSLILEFVYLVIVLFLGSVFVASLCYMEQCEPGFPVRPPQSIKSGYF